MAQRPKSDDPSVGRVLVEHKIKVNVMNLYVTYEDMSGKEREEMLNFGGKARFNGGNEFLVDSVVNAVSSGELVESNIAYVVRSGGKSAETLTASLHLKREDFDLVKGLLSHWPASGANIGSLEFWLWTPDPFVPGMTATQPVVKLEIAVGMNLG